MPLVAYSDSEQSDVDDDVPESKPSGSSASSKPAFQKTEARKIRVDLPTIRADPAAQDEQPPAKRAKTQGAFGGFNSLLPAPKRAAQNGPKPGVSLKTSSEAAFSRERPSLPEPENQEHSKAGQTDATEALPKPVVAPEVKLVGNATRFRPLSVGNKKQKKRMIKDAVQDKAKVNIPKDLPVSTSSQDIIPAKKVKRSLFSVEQVVKDPTDLPASAEYQYEAIEVEDKPNEPHQTPLATPDDIALPPPPANSLDAVAADLNLTPAQRRHLFGRNSKHDSAAINVANFNLDSEYAHNEKLRQNGEAFEHRAVKSIAPGKHSLQQLVNNARSNQDSIEDKWAADRAKRGMGAGAR